MPRNRTGRARRRRQGPRLAADAGSAALELVLITPMLVLVLMFIVFAGRLTQAKAVIEDAAHQAARAASIAVTQGTATAQAQQAATTALAGRGLTCQAFTVQVNLNGFRPGGTVTATVTCTTSLGDLTLLKVPGSQTITASFTSVIDTYRPVSGTGSTP
jgi:Flp pilus assembly protein TadG